MPRQSHKGPVLRSHLISMLVRMIFSPPVENIEEQATLLIANLLVDLKILRAILSTRYPLPRTPVPKHSNLHLVQEYAQDALFQDRFESMLRVSPYVYEILINLLSDHTVFQNNSCNRQTPVWIQLMITLYRLRHHRKTKGMVMNEVRRSGAKERDSHHRDGLWSNKEI